MMSYIIDKLAWICIKDRKLLMTKSKGKELYYIPGGKREVGEEDKDALVREIKEELSISILTDTINYVKTFDAQADKASEGIIVKVICYQSEFKGEIRASSEIEKIAWMNYDDKERCSLVSQLILEYLKNNELID
ncbi:NUDIX hydrolase [Photorhabdus temperata]|uniref:NUDIX hydrolase n=1 Tax=Photorhabdus temperata TaxID=574560 RepID=UPI001FB04B92|nr:NUDIX domain-containing protein [Photorhabdus temperata]